MRRNKVLIYGSGHSFSSEFFTDRSVSHWAVGSLYPELKENIDLYFCMHQKQELSIDEEKVVDLNNYPLDAIIDRFNSNYFANSIAYMIAYALYNNYDEIYLCGIDLTQGSEYEFERPCVLYWMGMAKGLGVKMGSSSDLDKSLFLYGYDNIKVLIKKMEKRRDYCFDMAKKLLSAGKQRESDQFLGQYLDSEYWIKELKG